MRPREILCALLVLLSLVYPQSDVLASDTAQITKTIATVDRERADAQVRRDLTALDSMLGDDLTYIHASGLVQSKAEFMADLKSGKRIYTSIKYSDVNIRVLESTAVITAQSEIHVVHESKENVLSIRVTEVYAQRNGQWQLIAYQSTRLTP